MSRRDAPRSYTSSAASKVPCNRQTDRATGRRGLVGVCRAKGDRYASICPACGNEHAWRLNEVFAAA